MAFFEKGKTFSKLFPPPQFLSLATCGISTTDEDVKLVELKKSIFGGEIKPTFSRVMGTDIRTSLKNLASKHGVKFANATIPDEKAYLFITTIDAVSTEGLYDAVAFLIEGNVPLSLAESVFSYEIIEEYKGQGDSIGKMRLAVTVAPKTAINAQLELFQSAGITVVSFDTESQAIARAIIPHNDKRAYLIINIAEKKAGFSIVDRGVVQFSTTLNRSMDGQSGEIKAKANEILSFWADRNQEPGSTSGKVGKVILSGILPSENDFIESLSGMVNIEIAPADVWSNLPSLRAKLNKEFADSLSFAASIGALLPH